MLLIGIQQEGFFLMITVPVTELVMGIYYLIAFNQ